MYQRRKIDVETTFGFLKGSLGFSRCHVRGKEKVSQEIGIALMACNLHKLSLNAQKNKVTKEKQKIWRLGRHYHLLSSDLLFSIFLQKGTYDTAPAIFFACL